MKKRIFTAVALSAFFTLSVNAAEITDDFNVNVNLVNEERTVEIDGYIYGFDNIAITSSLEYLGPTDEYLENENGEIYAVEQFLTDSDGNYSVDLLLGEGAPSGWYKALISGAFDIVGDDSDFIHYIFYFDEDAFLETVALINSCEDVSELGEIFESNPYLGCEGTADFCGIFLNLIEEKGEFDTTVSIADLREQLNERITIADIIDRINKKEDCVKQTERLMTVLGYTESDIEAFAASIGDIFKQNDEKFGNFGEVEEFFKKAIILAKINNATYETMTDVIEENAEEIELDTSDYDKLNKTEVNKLITRKNFATIDKFKKAFYDAVEKIEDKKSNSSSSGGGGGGNKTSSGKKPTISPVLTPVTTPITQQPAENVKAHKFIDINGVAWAEKSIARLYEKGIISGKSETEFCPDDAVTREEFATLLVRAFEYYDENATAEFNDVNKNAWYASYVASAYNAGVAAGKDNGAFGIGEFISREDAAVMLFRVAKLKNMNIIESTEVVFDDGEKVADYAKTAVSSLAATGIINGVSDTEFMPNGITTRAQAAVLIERILYQEG